MYKSFVFWNNKGGVGKTLLTFLSATQYAEVNKDSIVVLVDMCPQANLSEIALGGNGTGQKNLETITQNKKTISDYIEKRLEAPFQASRIGYEIDYFSKISDYNNNLPNNMYIVAGNSDLDFQSKAIEFYSNAGEYQKNAWKTVKTWLRELLTVFTERHQKVVFFIDCNPSFSPYTELAIIAGTNLIIPCTADGSSARAVTNLMKLIYGVGIKEGQEFFASFNKKAKDYNIALPIISLIIQNKNRVKPIKGKDSKKQGKPATAFQGVMDEINSRVQQFKQTNKELFVNSNDEIIIDIKDCNTIAPIVSYNGFPLSKIESKRYKVYEQNTQANADKISTIKDGLTKFVEKLI